MDSLKELEYDIHQFLSNLAHVRKVEVEASITAEGKKRCEGVRGKEHGECITKYKVEGMKELIRRLSSARGKCNQTKDSRACMEKINFKIKQARDQLKRYQEILAGKDRDQFA